MTVVSVRYRLFFFSLWRQPSCTFHGEFCCCCQSAVAASLVLQQPYLPVRTAGVAARFSVAPHDPVAGKNDHQRIVAVGIAHCTRCPPASHAPCQFSVCCRLAVWNLCQGTPYELLERSSVQLYGKVKRLSCTGEVFFQLSAGLCKQTALESPVFCPVCGQCSIRRIFPQTMGERFPLCGDQQTADRRCITTEQHGYSSTISASSMSSDSILLPVTIPASSAFSNAFLTWCIRMSRTSSMMP